MQLLKCILTRNRCYHYGQTIKPRGVMVHSTGANNPALRRYVQPKDPDAGFIYSPSKDELSKLLGPNRNGNDWNRSGLDVCVHAFVGKLADNSSVAVCQTLPWNIRGWHAGSGKKGSANDTHISFEICEDDLTDPVYFAQAYQAAVELTAMLCETYSLNPLEEGVVICHQDGYQAGIASNHGDVYNWFPKFGKTMDDFRSDVAVIMRGGPEMVYYATYNDIPVYYQPAIKKVMDKGALKGVDETMPDVIDVSEDLCRTMTILDRLGKLD